MLEKIKWYVVEIGIKKYGPVGVMAGMAALGTFLAAHAGMLEQWGVTYGTWPLHITTPPSGQVILIELDTTSQAVIALVASLAAMAIRAGQHHATGTTAVEGGNRAGDPPAAA